MSDNPMQTAYDEGYTDGEEMAGKRIAELEARELGFIASLSAMEAKLEALEKAATNLYMFVLSEVSTDMSDEEIAEFVTPLAKLLEVDGG